MFKTTVNKTMKPQQTSKTITILAQDPGKTNYGVALVKGQLYKGRLRVKVVENFLLEERVTQLKDPEGWGKQSRQYRKKMRDLLKKHNPTAIVFERFMTRSIRGDTIECINVMLGLLRSTTSLSLHSIPAVTWKNWAKRIGIDLDRLYKETRATPHQIDATVLGIWLLTKELNPSKIRVPQKQLLTAVEKTSLSRLKKKRK